MGFDGKVWQDPREVAAAAEAVRHAEAERRVEDTRAQTMADAVRLGFADLAAAIVTAAGPEAIAAWHMRNERPPGVGIPVGSDCGLGIDPDGFNDASAQVDSDIDDLIDNQ